MVALRLAKAARVAGHEVEFISPTDGPFLTVVRSEGLNAEVVEVGGALDAGAVARLTRRLRVGRIDLVHTHAHFSVNVIARIAGRLAGARVLSHMHIENAFRAGWGHGAQIALDNATSRLCFSIVAVSEATAESVRRQGYPADRVIVIRNGIEVKPAEPVRLVEGPTILEVARLAEVKGQRTLLAAVANLDATAVFVGRDLEREGAYERELRAEAEHLGVADRVLFAGYRTDVAGLIAGCDVFCLPSFVEGLPLVVLEAMAQGKPVVATPVGGTPELVRDGETGLLVPPGDSGALQKALARLLSDPTFARRLGEAGRDRVETTFSAASMEAGILRIYEIGT